MSSHGKADVQQITVPFNPHPYQQQIIDQLKRFSVLVCHRRFGKTVLTINLLNHWALITKRKEWRAAYIAPLYRQAEDIAWDYLRYYSSVVPGIIYNKAKLRAEYPNGARISLLGSDNPDSLRGPYWDAAILDEYAQIRPNVFPEIIRPALTDRKGWSIFIGTPQGHNHFYDLWQDANKNPEWFALMFRASQTSVLDPVELEQARKEMTPEQYEQEFECSFEAALIGAYYGALMQDALIEKRITEVPQDPALLVHTAWDIGVDDQTAIWFFQLFPSGKIGIIDYHEENGFGADHYVQIINSKRYTYGTHLGPHDVMARSFPAGGKSTFEIAGNLGLQFTVVPRSDPLNGINTARGLIPKSWFDAIKCDKGIQALKSYRKEYSQRLSTFRNSPLHDWSSHGADAFRTMADGMELIPSVKPMLKIKMPEFRIPREGGWML